MCAVTPHSVDLRKDSVVRKLSEVKGTRLKEWYVRYEKCVIECEKNHNNVNR